MEKQIYSSPDGAPAVGPYSPAVGVGDFVFVSGIGCSSRIVEYVDTYGFNLLHGRAIPAAEGAKLTNQAR